MGISRRVFIKGAAAVGAAGTISARAEGLGRKRILVAVELGGGNDAFNTVIPVGERAYYAARPTLAIRASEALMIGEGAGLHPAMAGLHGMYQQGKLAIIQGVGWDGQSYSHLRSAEVWHRGTVMGEVTGPLAWTGLPVVEMEGEDLSAAMAGCAEKIESRGDERVFYVSTSGFDTHARQADVHGSLLGKVSMSVCAFMERMRKGGNDRDVMVMVFSEFGRRLRENGSAGTDHGTAGVVMLAGGEVKGGMYGGRPVLSEEVQHTVHVRECLAVVKEWMGGNAAWG